MWSLISKTSHKRRKSQRVIFRKEFQKIEQTKSEFI
jgi:hypothetical protein